MPLQRLNKHVVGLYEWVMSDVAKEVRACLLRGCCVGVVWFAGFAMQSMMIGGSSASPNTWSRHMPPVMHLSER